MDRFVAFPTHHADLVHDLKYNFYGNRVATCSSDQEIKVWNEGENGEWSATNLPKAHHASVWKVDWAHPEFGQVLCSCSFDRHVNVYEEKQDAKGDARWVKVVTLTESRDSVYDVKFAPRHLGLQIAACSADGFIRIYEAMDVMNLASWSLSHEFEVFKAAGLKNKTVPSFDWSRNPYEPPTIVVAAAGEKAVKIWEFNESFRKWHAVSTFEGNEDSINCVAWAPNMGRTFEQFATAGKDGTVRIWKIRRDDGDRPKWVLADNNGVQAFSDHKGPVWRVQWNHTGTILASSGSDGTVRLWKSNFYGKWACLSVISGREA
mmetsp:Transcript_5626/g.15957  ORF Transcript_5626/g.15957 Transcript_5626/m.15957 type:complete len:319 (+) Transcript_5626:50-1006(+)